MIIDGVKMPKTNQPLLDYITNLQQVVKDTKETADDMLYELNEENKKYKARIEKAIEYIKNNDNFWVALGEDCGKPNDDLDKLLNILRGEDK